MSDFINQLAKLQSQSMTDTVLNGIKTIQAIKDKQQTDLATAALTDKAGQVNQILQANSSGLDELVPTNEQIDAIKKDLFKPDTTGMTEEQKKQSDLLWSSIATSMAKSKIFADRKKNIDLALSDYQQEASQWGDFAPTSINKSVTDAGKYSQLAIENKLDEVNKVIENEKFLQSFNVQSLQLQNDVSRQLEVFSNKRIATGYSFALTPEALPVNERTDYTVQSKKGNTIDASNLYEATRNDHNIKDAYFSKLRETLKRTVPNITQDEISSTCASIWKYSIDQYNEKLATDKRLSMLNGMGSGNSIHPKTQGEVQDKVISYMNDLGRISNTYTWLKTGDSPNNPNRTDAYNIANAKAIYQKAIDDDKSIPEKEKKFFKENIASNYVGVKALKDANNPLFQRYDDVFQSMWNHGNGDANKDYSAIYDNLCKLIQGGTRYYVGSNPFVNIPITGGNLSLKTLHIPYAKGTGYTDPINYGSKHGNVMDWRDVEGGQTYLQKIWSDTYNTNMYQQDGYKPFVPNNDVNTSDIITAVKPQYDYGKVNPSGVGKLYP